MNDDSLPQNYQSSTERNIRIKPINRLPKVKTACFCMDLRVFCITVGFFEILSPVSTAALFNFMCTMSGWGILYVILLLLISLMIKFVLYITAMVVLYGLFSKKNPGFIMVYFYVCIIYTIVLLFVTLATGINLIISLVGSKSYSHFNSIQGGGINCEVILGLIFLVCLLTLCFRVYVVIVINSFLYEIISIATSQVNTPIEEETYDGTSSEVYEEPAMDQYTYRYA